MNILTINLLLSTFLFGIAARIYPLDELDVLVEAPLRFTPIKSAWCSSKSD